MLSFYKHRGYNIDDYPQAFKNYTQEISLPIYYDLSDEDIETVVKAVVVAVEKVLSKQEA